MIKNIPVAKNNRTITIEDSSEFSLLLSKTIQLKNSVETIDIKNKIIQQDIMTVLNYLPSDPFIDLLIIDPPYNLTKQYSEHQFKKMNDDDYSLWFESWFRLLIPKVKQTGSVYICCDWQSSNIIYTILKKYCIIRNRITWEREKGRGSKTNWKNCSEDIWYATLSNDYYFNVEEVKLKKKVLASYKDSEGNAKDWEESDDGKYRMTYPSNLMTDISIPFWSMPENTPHPTQKPEKLIAKLILASSQENDFVFDPFLGSGTTAVVAKKLNRTYCGIEQEEEYCGYIIKRLNQCDRNNNNISGYEDGIFWERNSKTEVKFKLKNLIEEIYNDN